jgi:hypothetical protein
MEETKMPKPKPKPQRVSIVLNATWGNDDAESTIRLSRRQWKNIESGARIVRTAWAHYEGTRFRVVWTFENSRFTLDGDDGLQCIVDRDVAELTPELWPPQERLGEQGPR